MKKGRRAIEDVEVDIAKVRALLRKPRTVGELATNIRVCPRTIFRYLSGLPVVRQGTRPVKYKLDRQAS